MLIRAHIQKELYRNRECNYQKSENQNPNYLSSDVLQWPESQPAPKGHKQDTPGRLSGDFSKHKLDEIVAGGKGK